MNVWGNLGGSEELRIVEGWGVVGMGEGADGWVDLGAGVDVGLCVAGREGLPPQERG